MDLEPDEADEALLLLLEDASPDERREILNSLSIAEHLSYVSKARDLLYHLFDKHNKKKAEEAEWN